MQTGRTPEDRLRQMIAAHQRSLLRLCCAILRDAALAEDAVQETFLKAYRSMDSFRGAASEKTWLTTIALNTCRDLRRSSWFRFVDRRVTPEMLPQPSSPVSDEEMELAAAVMALPLRQREAVLLYYYQGLTLGETAQALGVSHQAVSDRLRHARRSLRALLERSELHE